MIPNVLEKRTASGVWAEWNVCKISSTFFKWSNSRSCFLHVVAICSRELTKFRFFTRCISDLSWRLVLSISVWSRCLERFWNSLKVRFDWRTSNNKKEAFFNTARAMQIASERRQFFNLFTCWWKDWRKDLKSYYRQAFGHTSSTKPELHDLKVFEWMGELW